MISPSLSTFSGYRITPILQGVAVIGGATSRSPTPRRSCWRAIAGLLATTLAFSPVVNAIDVPLPPAPPGGRNEIKCERLTSTLLEQIPGAVWSGMPTWRSVKGGAKVHTCPPESGEQIQVPREYYRNYQLTLRWTVYDADNKIVSTKLLQPLYLWGGVPVEAPEPPVLRMLASIRRALWGV